MSNENCNIINFVANSNIKVVLISAYTIVDHFGYLVYQGTSAANRWYYGPLKYIRSRQDQDKKITLHKT